MNIQNTTYNNSPIYKTYTNNKNITFKGKTFYTIEEVLEASKVSKTEVADGIEKLTNKIKFLYNILKQNDRTTKPLTTQIRDSFVYINMDKTTKGKTKINLLAETNSPIYIYSGIGSLYNKINPQLEKQSLDITLLEKDGRMHQGTMSLNNGACTTIFERDKKTGKRNATGKYFVMTPNIRECNTQSYEMDPFGYDRTSITIRNIFFNLFSNLTKVKPDIDLIK